jgi:hypothetical protein
MTGTIPFEFHITGNPKIHDAASYYGIKSIAVDLHRPNGSILRTEHMTSYVAQLSNVNCLLNAMDEARKTVQHILKVGYVKDLKIWRVKVECPYMQGIPAQYIEAHYDSDKFEYPTSRNIGKLTPVYMATEREYDSNNFLEFNSVHRAANHIVELCVFDSYVSEDEDWMRLYADRKEDAHGVF